MTPSICESLRALVIMDEVGSDNPLGRDAADLIESQAARIEVLKRLVRQAYEEGVEDGIGWHCYPESGPRPQWTDDAAREEALAGRETP